jgi:hypothetical protein
MSPAEAKVLIDSVPTWHHRFEILPGVVTPGIYDPSFLLEKMVVLRLSSQLADQRSGLTPIA